MEGAASRLVVLPGAVPERARAEAAPDHRVVGAVRLPSCAGALQGRTVNIKWYLKREGVLDTTGPQRSITTSSSLGRLRRAECLRRVL